MAANKNADGSQSRQYGYKMVWITAELYCS